MFFLFQQALIKPGISCVTLGGQHRQIEYESLVSIGLVVAHEYVCDITVQQLISMEVWKEEFPVSVLQEVLASGFNAC